MRSSRQQLQQTSNQMEVQAARTRQLVQAWSVRVERAEEKVVRQRVQVHYIFVIQEVLITEHLSVFT